MAVPDRLEERVGEPEIQQVVDRFLPQIVIDAEDRRFGKYAVKGLVERSRGRQIPAERLLDNDPSAGEAAGSMQLHDDHVEERRRNRQIERRPRRASERRAMNVDGSAKFPSTYRSSDTSRANAASSTPPPCS
jgi:hypothetical protein